MFFKGKSDLVILTTYNKLLTILKLIAGYVVGFCNWRQSLSQRQWGGDTDIWVIFLWPQHFRCFKTQSPSPFPLQLKKNLFVYDAMNSNWWLPEFLSFVKLIWVRCCALNPWPHSWTNWRSVQTRGGNLQRRCLWALIYTDYMNMLYSIYYMVL